MGKEEEADGWEAVVRTDVEEDETIRVARASIHALLDAANVVLTSGSCAIALGRSGAADGGDGGEELALGMAGGSAASDFVLRALNLLRPCLARSGAEEESPGAGDVYSDDDEGFDDPEADIGFGDGLPGLGEDAGAAWASSDEEFPVVEDGDA